MTRYLFFTAEKFMKIACMKKKLIRINLSKNICEKSIYGSNVEDVEFLTQVEELSQSSTGCFTW